MKTESASPAPHMSPALRRASSAGVSIKTDVKIPKKGMKQLILFISSDLGIDSMLVFL